MKHVNELKTTIGLLEKSLYQMTKEHKSLQKRLIRKDSRDEDPDKTILCEILCENQELQKKIRQLQIKEGEVRYENEKLKCKIKVICGEKRKLIEQMVDKHIKARKCKKLLRGSTKADANFTQK